jgi:transposase
MGPCLAVEGPRTKAVFETYLERVLAPSLRPGQVVVMDNLSSHKGPRVRELLEAVTAKDAQGFFEHRGYHATAQLL